jgi:hypothetical protein
MMSNDKKYQLLFLERTGGRTYLHFTRLAFVSILALIVVSVTALLLLFLTRPALDDRKIDVNVRPLPSAATTPETVIKQAPPPKPPPTIRQPPLPPKPSPSIVSSSPLVGANKQTPTQNSSKPSPQP